MSASRDRFGAPDGNELDSSVRVLADAMPGAKKGPARGPARFELVEAAAVTLPYQSRT